MEIIYSQIAGIDILHDKFNNLYRKAWKEDFNYIPIERSGNTVKVDLIFVVRTKKLTLNAPLKRKLLRFA